MYSDSVNRGSGIAVVFKTPLKMMVKHIASVCTTFEFAYVTNNFHSVNFIFVCNIYQYYVLTEFEQFVIKIPVLPGKLSLLGDFNVHWETIHQV